MPLALSKNTDGQALIQSVIAIVISSIVSLGMISMVRVSGRAERGIASNSDLTQLVDTLRLILENKNICEKSGLIGIKIDPNSPHEANFQIHVPENSGNGAVLAAAGKVFGARQISGLVISSMVNAGPVGAETLYFSTLSLKTKVVGEGVTSRNPDKNIFFYLVLDSGNQVTDCYGTAASGLAPKQNLKYLQSNSNFTVPPGISQLTVEVWGGGGGGCGGDGGAGGGGGYAYCILDVVEGQTFSVTVGTGGASGGTVCPPGRSGGKSSFSGYGYDCRATGGGEGALGGGTGGIGMNGIINLQGESGEDLQCVPVSNAYRIARGGGSPRGGGGGVIVGGGGGSAQFAGRSPGGGGAAECWDAGALDSGAGAAGAVSVHW